MNPSGYADLLNTSYLETDTIIIGQLILPNLDPNSVPYIDSDNTVQDLVLTDHQVIQGVTGGPPIATSTPTVDNLTTTNVYELTNGYTLIGPGTPATNSYVHLR